MLHPDPPKKSDRPDPLTIDGLKVVVNQAIARHSFTCRRFHVPERSEERNISFADVDHVCQTGRFRNPPQWTHGNWKYEIIGTDLMNEETFVCLAVDKENYWVTVVTFY